MTANIGNLALIIPYYQSLTSQLTTSYGLLQPLFTATNHHGKEPSTILGLPGALAHQPAPGAEA